MKITVRPKRGGWRRVTFRIPDETFEKIGGELCERYGFRVDEALRIILLHGYLDDDPPEANETTFKKLQEDIGRLSAELYELEGKWSPP